MHGLMNRAVQCFVRDAYGPEVWCEVTQALDLGIDNFEAMLTYEDRVTHDVLEFISKLRAAPREALLEDIGTYLVSHPNVEALRRLLRFGGVNFVDFLHSLNELRDRARLAVPDLDLPFLDLRGHTDDMFSLEVRSDHAGFGHVLVGVLRAMADDYGTLALLEFQGRRQRVETIHIQVLEARFAEGRSFELAAPAG